MKLSPWAQICTYVAADAALNVSARGFQIYCTWYFLKFLAADGGLSSVLLSIWITSTVLLPFVGVLGDRIRKSFILVFAGSLAVAGAFLSLIAVEHLGGNPDHRRIFYAFLVIGVISSSSIALLFPLGTPLIAEIASSESDIHRGIRLKSSMFIVNLLFGPTLAGLVIGRFSGEAALVLATAAAVIGLGLALIFSGSFSSKRVERTASSQLPGFFHELRGGVRRVLRIKAERTIAIASLFANMLLVPFLFLVLPAKVIGSGMSMLELAGVEIAMGAGVLASSGFLIRKLQTILSEHGIASLGVCVLGLSIFSFAYVESLWLLCFFAFALGVGLTAFNVTVNSKRASAIPDGYRATMESTLLFACTLAAPAGIWLSKIALKSLSPDQVIVLGSGTFLVAITAIAFSRALRDMLNTPQGATPYYVTTNHTLFN